MSRIEELAAKQNAGTLNGREKAELRALQAANSGPIAPEGQTAIAEIAKKVIAAYKAGKAFELPDGVDLTELSEAIKAQAPDIPQGRERLPSDLTTEDLGDIIAESGVKSGIGRENKTLYFFIPTTVTYFDGEGNEKQAKGQTVLMPRGIKSPKKGDIIPVTAEKAEYRGQPVVNLQYAG